MDFSSMDLGWFLRCKKAATSTLGFLASILTKPGRHSDGPFHTDFETLLC